MTNPGCGNLYNWYEKISDTHKKRWMVQIFLFKEHPENNPENEIVRTHYEVFAMTSHPREHWEPFVFFDVVHVIHANLTQRISIRVSQKTKFVDCWSVDLWIFWRIDRSTDLKFVDMSTNFKFVSQETKFVCWPVDFFCKFVDKFGWCKNSVFCGFCVPDQICWLLICRSVDLSIY